MKNIPKGETIGIENIPIYQRLPDIVNKEYNLIPYGVKNTYNYKIVDYKSLKLSNYVIVTYDEIEYSVLRNSPKILLVDRLRREKYTRIYTVSPNFRYFYFGDQKDYYFSTLIVSPVSVSIYHK